MNIWQQAKQNVEDMTPREKVINTIAGWGLIAFTVVGVFSVAKRATSRFGKNPE